MTCLTLNGLGLQTCSEESGGAWRILDCGSPDTEVRTYPFGWYQKPGRSPGPAASSVGCFPAGHWDDSLGLGRSPVRVRLA